MSARYEHYSDTFVECKTFNVVLVGDSRVGKSTFVNLLQQQLVYTSVEEPYKSTTDPELTTLHFYDQTLNRHICVNILDTPGLNETPAAGAPRPNEELKDKISDYIKQNFCSIDLILIAFQKRGITDNVIESLFEIKEWFGNKYLDNIGLLITHADEYSQEAEKEYVRKLVENPSVRGFCTAIKYRILFSGRNNPRGPTTDELKFTEEQNRRKLMFLDLIFKANNKKLSDDVNLNDIRPIDILESAATTNKDVLGLAQVNRQDDSEIADLLVKLHALKLGSEDRLLVDELINKVGEIRKARKLVEVTENEIKSAKSYNESELALKKKARQLQRDSFWLKTQLKVLRDTLNRFQLFEEEKSKPVEQEKIAVVVGPPSRRKK